MRLNCRGAFDAFDGLRLAERLTRASSSKYLDQAHTTWLDTDIELSGDMTLEIVASGQVSLYRGGGYECGPKGHPSYSSGTHPSGALLGRIGTSGEIFLIGEKYNGTPKGSGKLYLRMAHSPWPGQAQGSYKVTITPNPGSSPTGRSWSGDTSMPSVPRRYASIRRAEIGVASARPDTSTSTPVYCFC